MKKKNSAGNKRKSTLKQLKQQNLLEVTVRSAKAAEQRNRRAVKWFCTFILTAAIIGGIFYGVREGMRRFFWENPDYKLSEIEIATDGSLARGQILEVAGIPANANIFSINISKAREHLAQLPQVDVAEIQRLLPNKISINITERKPVAWIAAKFDQDPTVYANSWLVDGKGILIKSKNQLSEYFHLPVIYGVRTDKLEPGKPVDTPEMKAALDLVRLNADSAAQTRFQVRSIDVSKGYCLVVTDRNHASITFGLEHIDSQLERLLIVLDHIEQSKRELQTVNLMVQQNIPVTFMPPSDSQTEIDEAKTMSDGKIDKPKSNPASALPLKKNEPLNLSHPLKTKPVMPVKKASPVDRKTNESKPVRRATPVNSQN